MSDPFEAARLVIRRAIAARIFPAAVVEVGDCSGVRWREGFGSRTFADSAPIGEGTIFDLASLAKPVATTSIVMRLLADSRLSLSSFVGSFIPEWRGDGRKAATIRDLLEHASGLPARLLDAPPEGRREFEHDICATPLEYALRSRSIYSDLGFILLGFIAEDCGEASLADQFNDIVIRVTAEPLTFGVRSDLRPLAAPTTPLENDPRRGRTLVGEVQDNYAASLGGIAGHAGLFGTAASVGSVGRIVLRAARGDSTTPPPFSPALVALVTTRSAVPSSSRALGWDTLRPTSSCGTRMSTAAFGHVGFTGTSLWIDPALDKYFVLLTNRVCDGGTSDEMQQVRRSFHDAVLSDTGA
jgi:CubicO group peptidase (beta-lactamase class C family)